MQETDPSSRLAPIRAKLYWIGLSNPTQVSAHPCAAAARGIFPDYPGPIPAFLPPRWLAEIAQRP